MIKVLWQKWRGGLVGLLVSTLALLVALSHLDIRQLQTDLANARYVNLMPCAALLVCSLVVRSQRWRGLVGGRLSLGDSFNFLSIAYLLNSLLPLRAGELARIYLASQAEVPIPAFKSTSTIILERLLDTLMILCLMLLSLALGPLPDSVRIAAGIAAPVAFAFLVALLVLVRRRALAERLLTTCASRVPFLRRYDVSSRIEQFMDGLQPLTDMRRLLTSLMWTALAWFCTVSAVFALMYAFYGQVNWLAAALCISALSLAVAAPAVPGNVGTYELSILLALQAAGYGEPASRALAFAVLLHLTELMIYIIAGLFSFTRQGTSFGQLVHTVRALPATYLTK